MIITADILINIESIIGHNCKAGVGMMPAHSGVMKLIIITIGRRAYDSEVYREHTHKFYMTNNTSTEDVYQHFRAIKPKFDKALAIT